MKARFSQANRSKEWLAAVRRLPCVSCGTTYSEAAHYSGRYSHMLGKGMGQKAWDHCVAALCRDCHTAMDAYADGNDDARAARFMVLILQTQRQLLAGASIVTQD